MKVFSFKLLNHAVLIFLSVLFIVPILTLFSISISGEASILQNGYSILPKEIDFSAYLYVFENPAMILNAYKVTIIVSVTGAVISLFIMMMCAYALSRSCFKYRRILNFYIFFTMLFNGGMIPSYILTTQYLRLQDTLLILMLSSLVNAWYIFILRTFIKEIPESIIESAMLDGASEFRIFISLILPLSKAALATIGLFVLLGYWNEWMTALLYITKPNLYPLQYLLQKILQNLQQILQNMDKMPAGMASDANVPNESVRMALAIVAAGPMLFIMPFFQKYFARGMTVGSVKG